MTRFRRLSAKPPGRRCTAVVHVADRSAHAVPVEASATVVVAVADRRAWPSRRGGLGWRRAALEHLAPEHVAAVALDGALRLELAARPLGALVDGRGRADLADDVGRRVRVDLERLGLDVLGLWLGEVGDPTGHFGHWAGVREAVVAAGARVQVAGAERDAVVAEHALAAQSWAAWRVAGLVREGARAEVAAASVRADHAPALVAASAALVTGAAQTRSTTRAIALRAQDARCAS